MLGFSLFNNNSILAFDDGFFWEFGAYFIDDSPADSGLTNFFEIFDLALEGNGPGDLLAVTVESKDSGGGTIEILDLDLTEQFDDGIFAIDHMVFMEQEAEFDVTDTALITIEDPCDEAGGDTDGNCVDTTIETLSGASGESVIVYSDTTGFAGAIEIDLVETGEDTSFFTRQLTFTTTGPSDAANAILEVSAGDVITVEDQKTLSLINGLIIGDPDRFAILVEVGGTVEVTATETGGGPVTDFTFIDPPFEGGRGSGGLVTPGLVVDTSSPSSSDGGGSGCDGDCSHPTLGVDENFNRIVSNGFSFNGNPVDVKSFYTPYPLIKVNVGEENKVVLKVFENWGPQNIEHVGLGFGLGENEFFSDSRATINLDRTHHGREIVSTFDPENVLENVRVITSEDKCDRFSPTQCLIVTIFHTFREPLEFNMVATYLWDFKLNSWQNFYNDGIKIEGDSLNPPKTMMVAFGTKEMRGLIELTQIDKIKDTWIDEFGNIYQHKGNSYFHKIYDAPDEVVYDKVTNHGCDRTCNWFDAYKLNEVLEAEITLDNMLQGKSIQDEIYQKHFTYDYDNAQK